MDVKKLKREFKYDGNILPDPDPSMSLDEVKKFYAGRYPGIVTSITGSPEIDEVKEKVVYEFSAKMGTKG